MNIITTDLFEDVKSKVGCLNISDLLRGQYRSEAIRTMRKHEVTAYPLSSLEDMADYLFDEKVYFADHEEAHRYFVAHE